MTSTLWRVRGALHRSAALVLALACILTTGVAAQAASGPRIVSVDVSGNVHVPTSTIMAVVEARPGDTYNPDVVKGDLQRIFALGYFADQAAPLIRQRPGGVAITYRVVENPVISAIDFTGNKHVPADTLLALMDTSVGQVLNTNTLRNDFLKINSYYDRIGYGGQLATHVKNLNITPSGCTSSCTLSIDIQEGLTITKVTVGGDPILPQSAFTSKFTAKPGEEYSEAMKAKDAQIAQDVLDKYSLLLADFEGGIDPTTIDEKAGTAQVKYDVWVAKVGLVQITGNTKTKDQVIRRLLYERPGMIMTKAAVNRDLDALNNTGFFSKVDVNPKPCPEPMLKNDPGCVVLNWIVTEQKTAQASVGAGYSGGLTGQGLYGTLGYSDTNLHGTGNSVSIQFENGARTYDQQAQIYIPYVGNTPQSQRYSFGLSLFNAGNTYYYPVYTAATGVTAGPTSAPIPVTLLNTGNETLVSGIVATSVAKQLGLTTTVGRRMSEFFQLTGGVGVERIKNATTVPSPYFFATGTPNIYVAPTPGPLSNLNNNTGSYGIVASSVALVNTGVPYQLNTLTLGVGSINVATLDDIFNPRRGMTWALDTSISNPAIGSNFRFTQTTLDAAKFFPVLKDSTLGFHLQLRGSTGAIPPNNLYTFSDQELRGYNSVFYGTDTVLGQIELRKPLTPNRKFGIALFADEGGFVVTGAQPELDQYTNRVIAYPGNWTWEGDYGIGLRMDVPQLGLHTIRIDFAKGSQGFHTSFGIGQSF